MVQQKGMQLLFWKKSSVSKVDPCGVGVEQVGCNSIQCQKWLHCCCSDVARQVYYLVYYHHIRSIIRVYYYVEMSFSVEHVLVIIVQ